jgi:hypothetical protein
VYHLFPGIGTLKSASVMVSGRYCLHHISAANGVYHYKWICRAVSVIQSDCPCHRKLRNGLHQPGEIACAKCVICSIFPNKGQSK